MRTLMFGWEYPPFRAGGLATATRMLVRGLIRQGIGVTLVVPFPFRSRTSPLLTVVSLAGKDSAPLRLRRLDSDLEPYGRPEAWGRFQGALYGANLFAEVERYAGLAVGVARAEPHDIVHVHDWMTFEAGIAARRVGLRPLVAHIHATEADRAGSHPNGDIVRLEARGLLAADAVIANSRYLRDQVVAAYGVDADKVHVVPWAVEEKSRPRRPGPAARPFGDDPVVLFLGRIVWQKGPERFVEIAARVAEFVPNAHFVMAGEGDLLPGIMENVAGRGLAPRFHFTGALSAADVRRVLRMADVCVMPSEREPFGLVALESMNLGTPVVIPKDSGVAEVARQAMSGDAWDVEETANKVVAMLRYPVLRDEVARRGREDVSAADLSLDALGSRVAAIYAGLAGAGTRT